MTKVHPGDRPDTEPARRAPTRERPLARLSDTDTRWCATCDTPLDPDGRSALCAACIAYRDRWKKQQKRLVKEGVITLAEDVNDAIVRAADQLEATMHQLATARTRSPSREDVSVLLTRMYEHAIILTGLIAENLHNAE